MLEYKLVKEREINDLKKQFKEKDKILKEKIFAIDSSNAVSNEILILNTQFKKDIDQKDNLINEIKEKELK